jgi:ketosteroid isomerase-like protein
MDMPDRDRILAAIDSAYADRKAGNTDALAHFWAPGATFRIAGEPSLLTPLRTGTAATGEAVAELIQLIRFHEYRRLDAVVEGNRAALRWEIDCSIGDGPVYRTEIAEFWEFDEGLRAKSLLQFVDTAQLAKMMV